MANPTTHPPPPGTALPTTPPPGAPPLGAPDPGKLAALRQKWREKYARLKAQRLGQAPPPVAGAAPAPGRALAPVPAVAGPVPAVAVSAPAVPWLPDTLRPLFNQIVPLLERADVASLERAAEPISRQAVELVRKKAGWSDAVKLTLAEGGAETCAKWLNKTGISAEFAPEVKLGVAICAILGARQMLLNELKQMAAEVKAEKEKAEKEKTAAAKAATPLSIVEKVGIGN